MDEIPLYDPLPLLACSSGPLHESERKCEQQPDDAVDYDRDRNLQEVYLFEGHPGVPQRTFDQEGGEDIPRQQSDETDSPQLCAPSIKQLSRHAASDPNELEDGEHDPCASNHRVSIAQRVDEKPNHDDYTHGEGA